MKTNHTKKVIQPVFGSLIALLIPLSGFAQDVAHEAQGSPQLVTVEVRDLGGAVPIGATIVPRNEVTLAAQLPGRVEFIAGREGDRFRAGQLLVALGEAELLAQRRAAQAEIGNAQAGLRDAEVQYSRELRSPQQRGGMGMPMMEQMPIMGQMLPGGGETKVERGATLHGYSTRIEQARSALAQSQSRLQAIDAKLRDTKSVAPFDGVILTKFVNIGDTVQPGQQLVSFGDVEALQIQADVPARLAPRLQLGTRLMARLDDPDKTELAVTVAQVFPMADPTRHTIRVKLDLPPQAPVAAGMYTQVLIPDATAQRGSFPIIPTSALVWRGGLPMVFVVYPDGHHELRLLRIGDQVGPDQVTILTGLSAGDQILVNPKRR
jgi:multidrug efflux pump subunit AcrA (membrane-fusion protein)